MAFFEPVMDHWSVQVTHLPIEPCGALTQRMVSVSGLKILPCLDWDPNPVPISLMTDGLTTAPLRPVLL